MESCDSGMDTSLFGMDSSIPCMDTPVFGENSMIGNTHAMVPKTFYRINTIIFFIAVYTNLYAFGPSLGLHQETFRKKTSLYTFRLSVVTQIFLMLRFYDHRIKIVRWHVVKIFS
jgi:hypothetical protein